MANGLKLRVLWPIVDDTMTDAEAVADAAMEWPAFAEVYQVTVLDVPRIRVIALDARRQRRFQATRAVVCEAPVVQRVPAGRAA